MKAVRERKESKYSKSALQKIAEDADQSSDSDSKAEKDKDIQDLLSNSMVLGVATNGPAY